MAQMLAAAAQSAASPSLRRQPTSSLSITGPPPRRSGSQPFAAHSCPVASLSSESLRGRSPHASSDNNLLMLSAQDLSMHAWAPEPPAPPTPHAAPAVVKLGFQPNSAAAAPDRASNVELPLLAPKPVTGSRAVAAPSPSAAKGLLARELSDSALESREEASPTSPGPAGAPAFERLQPGPKAPACSPLPPLPEPKRPALRRNAHDSSWTGASLLCHRLLKDAQAAHPVFKSPLVIKAFGIAGVAHEGQVRKNGEPVLSHCIETAAVLAELGLDAETVAAGLLHDVLDDTLMTEAQLRKVVPREVADMVTKVSRISDISQLQRDNLHLVEDPADLTSLLLALADVRALLIKLADRLHNLRTLSALPRAKQLRMATETLHVFAPLANRLGVWSLKAELEDLCFACLQPADAADLADKVADARAHDGLEEALRALSDALRREGVTPRGLSGRPKNLYGVWKKVNAKGALDRVHDVRAVRVIVRDKADCYVALRALHALYKPVEGRLKDYVRNPKPNGYQSLHTVVHGPGGTPLEIQIRTEKMELLAEYGVAAHWRYKEASAAPPTAASDNAAPPKPRDRPYEAALVAWARYVLQWRLEVVDKKLTVPGEPAAPPPPPPPVPLSPRRRTTAATHMSAPSASERRPSASLPGDPGSFERYFASAHAPTRPAPPPCFVIHSSPTSVAVREVPTGSTVDSVLRSGVLGELPAHATLLVNHRPAKPDEALRLGDEVEVVLAPMPADASRDGGAAPRVEEEEYVYPEVAGDGAVTSWPGAASEASIDEDPWDSQWARGGSPRPEELAQQREHLSKLYHSRSAQGSGRTARSQPVH